MNLTEDQIHEKLTEYTSGMTAYIKQRAEINLVQFKDTIDLISETFGKDFTKPADERWQEELKWHNTMNAMSHRFYNICMNIAKLPYVSQIYTMEPDTYLSEYKIHKYNIGIISASDILAIVCFTTYDPTDKNRWGAPRNNPIDVLITKDHKILILFAREARQISDNKYEKLCLYSNAIIIRPDQIMQLPLDRCRHDIELIKDNIMPAKMGYYMFAMFQSITDLVNHRFEKNSNEPISNLEIRLDFNGFYVDKDGCLVDEV